MKMKMGLVFHGKKLAWSWKHGTFLWLPHFVKRIIVRAWNLVACRLFGHDLLDIPASDGWERIGPKCSDCCKEL